MSGPDKDLDKFRVLILCYSKKLRKTTTGYLQGHLYADLMNQKIYENNITRKPIVVHTADYNGFDFKSDDFHKKHIIIEEPKFEGIPLEYYNILFSFDCANLFCDYQALKHEKDWGRLLNARVSHYKQHILKTLTDNGIAYIGNIHNIYIKEEYFDARTELRLNHTSNFPVGNNFYYQIRKSLPYEIDQNSYERIDPDGTYRCNRINDKIEFLFNATSGLMTNIFKSILPNGIEIPRKIIRNSNTCWFNVCAMIISFAFKDTGVKLTETECKNCFRLIEAANSNPSSAGNMEEIFDSINSRRQFNFVIAEYFKQQGTETGGSIIKPYEMDRDIKDRDILFACNIGGHYQLFSHKNTPIFNNDVKQHLTKIHDNEIAINYSEEADVILQNYNDKRVDGKLSPEYQKELNRLLDEQSKITNREDRDINEVQIKSFFDQSPSKPTQRPSDPNKLFEYYREKGARRGNVVESQPPFTVESKSTAPVINPIVQPSNPTQRPSEIKAERLVHLAILNEELKKQESLQSQPPEKNYVSGLVSLSLHVSDKYKRRILILGEHHNKDDLCNKSVDSIDADNFLYALLDKHGESLLDVFIESNYQFLIDDTDNAKKFYDFKEYNPKGKANFMHDVTRKLANQNCLAYHQQDNPAKCPYKNKRIHLIDIRESHDIDIINLFQIVSDIKRFLRDRRKYNAEHMKYYIKYIEYYKFDTNKKIQDGLKRLFSSRKFAKAVNTTHDFIRKKLIQKMKEIANRDYSIFTSENIIKLINETLKTTIHDNNIFQYFKIEGKGDYEKVNELVHTRADIMDIYAIARVFRRFDYNSKREINGPINDVIIYAGDYHCAVYRKFLDELKFDKLFEAKVADGQQNACLNITGFYEKYPNPLEFDNDEINPIEIDKAEKLPIPNKSDSDAIKEKIKTIENLIIYTVQFPMVLNTNITPYDSKGNRNPEYNKAFYESSMSHGSFSGKSSSSIIRIYESRFPHLKYDINDDISTIFLVLHTDKDEYKKSIFSKITENTRIIIVGHCCASISSNYFINSDNIDNDHLSKLNLDSSDDLGKKYITRDTNKFKLILSASNFINDIKNAGINKLGIIELNACNAYLKFKEPLITSLNRNGISFYGIISNMAPITRLASTIIEENKDVYDKNILGDHSIITMRDSKDYYLKKLFYGDSLYIRQGILDREMYPQTTFNGTGNQQIQCELQPKITLKSNQKNIYFYLITRCPYNKNIEELRYVNNNEFIQKCLKRRIVRIKYHGVYFVSDTEYIYETLLTKIITGILLFEAFYDINEYEANTILDGKPSGTFIHRLSSDKKDYVIQIVIDKSKNIIIKIRKKYDPNTDMVTTDAQNGEKITTKRIDLNNTNYEIIENGIKYNLKLKQYIDDEEQAARRAWEFRMSGSP